VDNSMNYDNVPTGPSGFHQGHGGFGGGFPEAPPSKQIIVRNLPWSTAHDDLVELFETTGSVELAEIIFEGTRSKGMGVVQFHEVVEAETAIAKFQGYVYGGRPLGMCRFPYDMITLNDVRVNRRAVQ
jgi:hypothetical protein